MMNKATIAQQATKPKARVLPNSPSDYSSRSPIRQAYSSNLIPPTHLRLLNAIKKNLGNTLSGEISLKSVLDEAGFHYSSGRNLLHHMQVFGILKLEPIKTKNMRVTLLKDPATLSGTADAMSSTEQNQNISEGGEDEVPVDDSPVEGAPSQEGDEATPPAVEEATAQVTAPTPADNHALTPLEALRQEVEQLVGPDGLDLNEEEKADYFFDLAGKCDIRNIPAEGLKLIIKDAKANLNKRDEI